jgi:hypothetical protein
MAAGAPSPITTQTKNGGEGDEPAETSVVTVMVQYQITVRTSDRAHAYTSAKVFVVLHGTGEGPGGEGGVMTKFPKSSGAIPLETPLDDSKKPFRRGAESVFMVDAPDVVGAGAVQVEGS